MNAAYIARLVIAFLAVLLGVGLILLHDLYLVGELSADDAKGWNLLGNIIVGMAGFALLVMLFDGPGEEGRK